LPKIAVLVPSDSRSKIGAEKKVGNGDPFMRLKTRVWLAAGCAGLLAISLPAFGNPAPRGHAHQPRKVHALRVVHAKKTTHAAVSEAKPLVTPATDPAHQATDPTHLVSAPVVMPPKRPALGWPALVREARKYMGTNPTARSRLWCATFMNLVLARLGYAGTNSDAALSFAGYGHRISDPAIGAIAVLSRGKRGGHVGVVSGIDAHGNPIIISGNHGHRVGEGVYPRARVVAYVMPTTRRAAAKVRLAGRAKPVATRIAARTPDAPIVRRVPDHPRFDPIIDSPITELLAAIEAEQSRFHGGDHGVSQAWRPGASRKRILAGAFNARARAPMPHPPRPGLQHGRLASAYAGRTDRQSMPR